MFFDSIEQIPDIAARTGTSIFVLEKDAPLTIKNALLLEPTDKATITIEQVRETLARLATKQTKDQFVIIRPAEKLGLEAGNALLKTLEEPGAKIHFILITHEPALLLPTILSRAHLYILRANWDENSISESSEEDKKLAKKLLAASSATLPALAAEITARKDQVRARALSILALSIEMLYKSYFLTHKDIFLTKLPKFLTAYDNISRNGHIKLHLVADLL